MKKHIHVTVAFFLIGLLGCSPLATEQPGSSIATPIHENSTNIVEPTISPSPNKLQITYMEIETDFTELFAVDVTCIENNDLCFGEPILLFKTSPASSDNANSPTGFIRGYSWSPDGEKLALSANQEIFVGDMNTQEWNNITNSADVEEYDPKWSQDRRYIYYLACTQDDMGMGSCKLARFNLADNTNTLLLDSIEGSIASFAVSPDDKNVVFSLSEGFDRLYLSNLDGSDVRRITVRDFEETSPSYSYDGKSIAFVRTNGPTLLANSEEIIDMILMNHEGGEEKNLTEGFDDKAFSPTFSFDGNWIAFDASDKNLNFNIYVVSVDLSTVIQVTQGNVDKVDPSWRLLYEQ